MTDMKVEFVALRQTKEMLELKDKFELRTDMPMVWLQKICFFILKKLKAFSQKETIKYDRVVINTGSFMDQIFEQRHELLKFFNLEPDRLLIGSEDYAELMKEQLLNYPYQFDTSYGAYRNGVKTVCGLTVEIIPYMRGILVMPKVQRGVVNEKN